MGRFTSKNGLLYNFWQQLRQLPYIGLDEGQFNEFLLSWEIKVNAESKYENLRDGFMAVTKYLSSYYGPKVELWSVLAVPQDESEKRLIFANTTNALESLHRQLNFMKKFSILLNRSKLAKSGST